MNGTRVSSKTSKKADLFVLPMQTDDCWGCTSFALLNERWFWDFLGLFSIEKLLNWSDLNSIKVLLLQTRDVLTSLPEM